MSATRTDSERSGFRLRPGLARCTWMLLVVLLLGQIAAGAEDLDLAALIDPVPPSAVFQDPAYHIWCGAMVRGRDGKYHLFYSRWPRELSHKAWVTHSEIARAVSDRPTGPFTPVGTVLPARGAEYWDGSCTHNPTLLEANGKYYLYYMGNRGDGIVRRPLNWTHRNNQRIGVAIADDPAGPWERFDRPALDVSPEDDAPDALMVSNPAVAVRPDGGFLMVYKAVAKKVPGPGGGPVTFCVATSDHPNGPFKKALRPLFTKEQLHVAAEDPFIWRGADRYWAVLRIDGEPVQRNGAVEFVARGRSLVLFQSWDGFDWQPAKHVLITTMALPWAGWAGRPMITIERPQLCLEGGRPVALLVASTDFHDNRDGSFNVQIPLRRSP